MNDPPIRPGTVFELTERLENVKSDLRLRNHEWGLLFAVTGEHTVAQIGDHFRFSQQLRDEGFARLLRKGLIRERRVTLDEYLKSAATIRDDQPKSLASFLRSGALTGEPGALAKSASLPQNRRQASKRSPRKQITVARKPAPPSTEPHKESSPLSSEQTSDETHPRPSASEPSSPTLTAPPGANSPMPASSPDAMLDEHLTRAVPILGSVGFRPLKGPAALTQVGEPASSETADSMATHAPKSSPILEAPKVSSRQLSLKALMAFINSRAPDASSGQLDIYRVFIRVDTRLLKRNGITTLRFSEDRLIDDPELQQAIFASVKKTLGVVCPSQVFVEAS